MFTNRHKRTLIALALAAAWLYTFSLLYQVLVTNNDNPRKTIRKMERYIHAAEKDFFEECADLGFILRLYNNSYPEDELKRLQKKPYALFVYRNLTDAERELRFWSANYAFPAPEHFQLPAETGIPLTLGNGTFEFCKKTIQVNNTSITIACLIPIVWEYFIENDYLKKSFVGVPDMEKKYEVSPTPKILSVKNGSGQILVYLDKKKGVRNTGYSSFVVITRLLSVMLVIAFIYFLASVVAKKKFGWGLAIVTIGFTALRVITITLPFPFVNSRLEIFDPVIYASGLFLSSLGDLVFTVILFFLLVQFVLHHRKAPPYETSGSKNPLKAGMLVVLLVTVALTCGWLLRSLVKDSEISFNVTNFFSLNFFSVLGFLSAALIVLIYYQLSVYLLFHIWKWSPARIFPYLVAAVAGLALLYLQIPLFSDRSNIFILLWLLLCMFIKEMLVTLRFQRKMLLRDDVVMLLFLSMSVCALFMAENTIKELDERKLLAEKLGFRSDAAVENLLSIATTPFDNNFLSKNMDRWMDKETGSAFKDTLARQNFVGYLNKFETKIYTYDSAGMPVNNPDSTSLKNFTSIITTNAQRHNIQDVFVYEVGFDEYSYVFYKEVIDTLHKRRGYFIVHSQPLKYRVAANLLYPELLRMRTDNLYERLNNYVYAVYKNLGLYKQFIDYDFPVKITAEQIPLRDDTLVYRKGYQELWHKIDSSSVVVIGKKTNFLISAVTLFAYLFFVFMTVMLLYRLVQYLVTRSPRNWWNKRMFQFTIRNQVQGIIAMVSLLSFFVIGVTIISLFRDRFKKNNRERLARTVMILERDVESKMDNQYMFDDVVRVFQPGANPQLEDNIYKLSEIHKVDFNIYGVDGTLGFSSQPYVRNREILGDRIDPVAFYHLKTRESAQYIQDEKIGSFSYLSMYVPVRDTSGKPYCYLNIPYYASSAELKEEISNFLVTIINLNAFIFLIAGLIAWLVTSRITRSFLLIGEKMKEVNLGKNEAIVWKRNDEIGDLVSKYNEMVRKLEESAARLAKSEREDAWREMARQVAHEIKNPLTPMKLSIQYLQKSITEGSGNIQELTASVSQTLVEQIDHLSKIAADFSQFANLGNSKAEPILLHETLQKITDLFAVEPGAVITLAGDFRDCMVKADKTQINRLFTNLVTNALQAYDGAERKPVELQIVQQTGNFAVIRVRDHGPGIEESLREKIFTPNFTTKTSGTGLGLAISKGIVEQSGGEIWFETGTGGTSFFVRLPLAETGTRGLQ